MSPDGAAVPEPLILHAHARDTVQLLPVWREDRGQRRIRARRARLADPLGALKMPQGARSFGTLRWVDVAALDWASVRRCHPSMITGSNSAARPAGQSSG